MVIVMSLGGFFYAPVNNAIQAAKNKGIFVVVAGGNNNQVEKKELKKSKEKRGDEKKLRNDLSINCGFCMKQFADDSLMIP